MSEPTCAEVLARTLRRAGVEVMFGLPGGEILDFLEAARQAGIRFVLTRNVNDTCSDSRSEPNIRISPG